MVTLEQLKKIVPYAGASAPLYLGHLNNAMEEFGINTPAREAAFLAQVAHESGSFRYTLELADGSAYEGRKDLGNTQPGDGRRYKGRGLIQITGRANYAECAKALGLPLLERPEILEQAGPAARSAAWFWASRGLNELADAGNFDRITRRINGGTNGAKERLAYYAVAQEVLA
jgi:putative chitinase